MSANDLTIYVRGGHARRDPSSCRVESVDLGSGATHGSGATPRAPPGSAHFWLSSSFCEGSARDGALACSASAPSDAAAWTGCSRRVRRGIPPTPAGGPGAAPAVHPQASDSRAGCSTGGCRRYGRSSAAGAPRVRSRRGRCEACSCRPSRQTSAAWWLPHTAWTRAPWLSPRSLTSGTFQTSRRADDASGATAAASPRACASGAGRAEWRWVTRARRTSSSPRTALCRRVRCARTCTCKQAIPVAIACH